MKYKSLDHVLPTFSHPMNLLPAFTFLLNTVHCTRLALKSFTRAALPKPQTTVATAAKRTALLATKATGLGTAAATLAYLSPYATNYGQNSRKSRDFWLERMGAGEARFLLENELIPKEILEEADEETGNSLLMDAVERGQFFEAKRLVQAGADADFRNPQTGKTALDLVMERDGYSGFIELFTGSAQLDARNEATGETPLDRAFRERKYKHLQRLLRAGAKASNKSFADMITAIALENPIKFGELPRDERKLSDAHKAIVDFYVASGMDKRVLRRAEWSIGFTDQQHRLFRRIDRIVPFYNMI